MFRQLLCSRLLICSSSVGRGGEGVPNNQLKNGFEAREKISLIPVTLSIFLQGGTQSPRERQLRLHQVGEETLGDHPQGGLQVPQDKLNYYARRFYFTTGTMANTLPTGKKFSQRSVSYCLNFPTFVVFFHLCLFTSHCAPFFCIFFKLVSSRCIFLSCLYFFHWPPLTCVVFFFPEGSGLLFQTWSVVLRIV
jgi:hypothetical protein